LEKHSLTTSNGVLKCRGKRAEVIANEKFEAGTRCCVLCCLH